MSSDGLDSQGRFLIQNDRLFDSILIALISVVISDPAGFT